MTDNGFSWKGCVDVCTHGTVDDEEALWFIAHTKAIVSECIASYIIIRFILKRHQTP
jgi:hypothetical protein